MRTKIISHQKNLFLLAISLAICLALIGCQKTAANAPDERAAISKLGKEDVIRLLKDNINMDVSTCTSDAEGVRNNTIHYIRISIIQGKENDIRNQLKTICGEPTPARCRKHPVFNNEISDAFNEAVLLDVYDYLKSGTNGAKTESITFYTAKRGNNAELYIFGTFPDNFNNTKE